MADTTRNITEFFETDYKDFAQYVIENRALISVIDGLKTGARKIMHAAFIGSLKDYKQKKVPNLSGETMNFSLYPHGDMSLNSTIVTLSQEHKFNLNPLYIDSQNGSLRDDSVSSPRYLYVKLSKYAKLWKADIELTERIFEEGQYTEPKYYLPIIPVAILNRQEGMCQGFRFSTMSYNPIDVIDACKKYLTDKAAFEKCTIHPYVRGIKKTNWIKQKDGSWVNVGEYSWDPKKRIVRITDLPYDVEYKDFEKLLNKMVDALDIKEWFNFSEDGNVDYRIDCSRGDLYEEIKKDPDSVIMSKFKLAKTLPADLLWVLDENKKVLHFENIKDLIAYFIDFRLKKYTERKSRLVKIKEAQLQENEALVKFITLVCDGKLDIINKPKSDIEKSFKKIDVDMKLLSTPMSKCTKEEKEELISKSKELQNELDYIKNTSETQLYLNDLEKLRSDLLPDFK